MQTRLTIRNSVNKGRGVFAVTEIAAGEIFESSQVIVIPQAQLTTINQTVLFDYYFYWGLDKQDGAIALGFGSLYNHSYSPNALYVRNLSAGTIDFCALRKIEKDEEITVNYNGEAKSQEHLWFEVKT